MCSRSWSAWRVLSFLGCPLSQLRPILATLNTGMGDLPTKPVCVCVCFGGLSSFRMSVQRSGSRLVSLSIVRVLCPSSLATFEKL